ncbi:hypothetical protein LP419_34955 [Massilia sp. H-1]|nr:hypothetical protein LP419_34955 [Massilia sp. H-1]
MLKQARRGGRAVRRDRQGGVRAMKGYRITIKPVPWKRGMSMLKAGTAFALYPPYMNLKEEPFTWPYSLPLFEEIVVAVCTREVAARPAPPLAGRFLRPHDRQQCRFPGRRRQVQRGSEKRQDQAGRRGRHAHQYPQAGHEADRLLYQ